MSDFRVGDIVQFVDMISALNPNPVHLDGKPPKRKFMISQVCRRLNEIIGGTNSLDFVVLLDLVTSEIHDSNYPNGGVPIRMIVKVPGIIQFVNQNLKETT